MKRLALALGLLVSMMLAMTSVTAAEPPVEVYCYENFTGYHAVNRSYLNLKSYTYTYSSTCEEYFGHESEQSRTVPCTKTANLNDDLRAIEINWDNIVVEVYEHANYEGRSVRFSGTGRWVFPAWMWDRASSIAIYSR